MTKAAKSSMPSGCALVSCPHWDTERGICTHEGPCIYNVIYDTDSNRVEELEAEIAALREAIVALLDTSGQAEAHGDFKLQLAKAKAYMRKKEAARQMAEDALANCQTDKVLVDIEKLREIEAGGNDGLSICPVCRNDLEDAEHAENCWLGNILNANRIADSSTKR